MSKTEPRTYVCPNCSGIKRVAYYHDDDFGVEHEIGSECPVCAGIGELDDFDIEDYFSENAVEDEYRILFRDRLKEHVYGPSFDAD